MIILKAYVQENDTLLVEFYPGIYTVDGQYFKFEGYKTTNIIVDRGTAIKRVNSYYNIECYQHRETHEELSVPEYQKLEHALLEAYDYETDRWKSIEDRHKHELLSYNYIKKYSNTESHEDVELEIVGNASNGNEFVIPTRKLTGDLTNTIYIHKVKDHITSIVKSCLLEEGYTELKSEPPLSGIPKGVEKAFYLKSNWIQYSTLIYPNNGLINRNYLTIAVDDLREYENFHSDKSYTYDGAMKSYNDLDEKIRKSMKRFFMREKLFSEAKGMTFSDLLTDLKIIERSFNSITCTKATKTEYIFAYSKLVSLIKKIKLQIDGES